MEVIDKLQIKYAQNGTELFCKSKEDCALDGQTVSVTLSQEETLKFDCYKRQVQIQVKVKTTGGAVVISPIIVVDLEKCLFDEVI